MNNITNLENITNDLITHGKTPKITVLKSAVTRKRKSALGMKTHSSNGRRFNNNANPLKQVA